MLGLSPEPGQVGEVSSGLVVVHSGTASLRARSPTGLRAQSETMSTRTPSVLSSSSTRSTLSKMSKPSGTATSIEPETQLPCGTVVVEIFDPGRPRRSLDRVLGIDTVLASRRVDSHVEAKASRITSERDVPSRSARAGVVNPRGCAIPSGPGPQSSAKSAFRIFPCTPHTRSTTCETAKSPAAER